MKKKSDVNPVMAYTYIHILSLLSILCPSIMYGSGTDFRFPLKELSIYLDHSLSMSILENNRICDNRTSIILYEESGDRETT